MKIAFIGLGSMGLPMASNLLRARHDLIVYNRTQSRAEKLAGQGARVAQSPRAAASGVDVVVTMLADDAAVEAVTFGDEGLMPGLSPGAVHVSMSTISPALSRRLAAEHETRGQAYLAAPVFGRPEAAEAAKLWILAAGPADAIEGCRPLFEAMGQGVDIVGEEAYKANVLKLAGNFILASAIGAMGEAFALVRKHGIDPQRLHEIVNVKVLRSPVYENYGRVIIEHRYEPAGFKLKHGLKDIRLALAAGEEVTVPLPFASLLRDEYLAAMARGWDEIDWAALARLSAVNAGLE